MWVWNTFQLGCFGGECVWLLFIFLFLFWAFEEKGIIIKHLLSDLGNFEWLLVEFYIVSYGTQQVFVDMLARHL